MLPASKLEKYISMILITGIIVPLIFAVVYLGLDIMVCMVDRTCGSSMFSLIFFTDFKSLIVNTINPEELLEWGQIMENITSVFTPFLYLDDVFQSLMLFLLGALIFKTSKTGKTLGCLILIGLSLEMILSPIIAMTSVTKIQALVNSDMITFTPDMFRQTFPFISWTLDHVVLVDTIWDGMVNCLILFLIWLRFSRMKH